MSTRRRWIVGGGIAVAGAAVAVALLLRGDGGGSDAVVASGTVEATEGHLGFQAPGRVHRVAVREGDAVEAGDTLALLDRSAALARRAQVRAEIRAAGAALRELRTGSRPQEVARAEAGLEAARERVEDARRDLERTRRLHDGGAVSRQALDKAEVAFRLARSRAREAAETLDLVREGPPAERIDAQEARLEAAEAALAGVEATLSDMVVVAPFDGVVTVRHREPGETVAPGGAVVTLMNPDDRWVRIYVREDRVGALSLGQDASITSDTYPERRYPGSVAFIASEAEFTPKNVQTREERVRLVFAVKVRVEDDPARELKPGMPADVRIDIGAP